MLTFAVSMTALAVAANLANAAHKVFIERQRKLARATLDERIAEAARMHAQWINYPHPRAPRDKERPTVEFGPGFREF